MGLTEVYGDYVAPHTLEMCYDMKTSNYILKFMMLLKEKERLKLRIVVRF